MMLYTAINKVLDLIERIPHLSKQLPYGEEEKAPPKELLYFKSVPGQYPARLLIDDPNNPDEQIYADTVCIDNIVAIFRDQDNKITVEYPAYSYNMKWHWGCWDARTYLWFSEKKEEYIQRAQQQYAEGTRTGKEYALELQSYDFMESVCQFLEDLREREPDVVFDFDGYNEIPAITEYGIPTFAELGKPDSSMVGLVFNG
jgi:hypothetical protein